MISAIDLAWAAGFLEGEGTFAFGRRLKADRPEWGSAQVAACQVQREPLDRLQSLFDGSDPAEYHWLGPSKNKSAWFWRVYGPRAVGIMMTLYHFMSPRRREQIRSVLDRWKSAPGWRKKWAMCSRGHDLTLPRARTGRNGNGQCSKCVSLWQKERRKQRAASR